MRYGKLSTLASIMAAAVTLAAPAHADVDTDFANQLHVYGIYGPGDYNTWLAKSTCTRMDNGVDTTAETSAEFLSHNLARSTDTTQTWQVLAAAIDTYCPEQRPMLTSVARPH
jgi:Protein of unknown function (DUF732)